MTITDYFVALGGMLASLGAAGLLAAGLIRARAATWGRMTACRWLGVAAPRYRGAPLARLWWSVLSPAERARSILGAAKRVICRRLHWRLPARPSDAIVAFRSQAGHGHRSWRGEKRRAA